MVAEIGGLLSWLLVMAVLGDEPKSPESKPAEPEGIRHPAPTFLVRADVNRGTRSYREGDSLYAQVACEADAYVYVLYKQADGEIFQIFPNSEQPDNRVKARQAVQIPAPQDLFRWVIGPPFGKELFKVIASKEPLEAISDPAMRQKFFNPVSRQQVKGVEMELGKEQFAWAEDTVEITTYPRGHAIDASQGRRYGLFIGVGDYEFIAKKTKRPDGKEENEPLPCHRDARRLAAVLQEVGQLADVRIYTNDQATRENLDQAIAGWLPAVSRPGDTVLIFFSGLALPLPGPQGGARRAVLLPHDFTPPNIVAAMVKARQEGKLPPAQVPRVEKLVQAIRRAGSEEQATEALFRASGIPGDVLAHWLQRLAGRQIVLVLDTGFAAGFVPDGTTRAQSLTFDSLSSPVSRLKGLGQQEIALLGACDARQSDVLRSTEMSLMSGCLVRVIASAPGALSLEQAHEKIAAVMEQLFEEANRQRRTEGKEPVPSYKPYFLNTCNKPVLLKP